MDSVKKNKGMKNLKLVNQRTVNHALDVNVVAIHHVDDGHFFVVDAAGGGAKAGLNVVALAYGNRICVKGKPLKSLVKVYPVAHSLQRLLIHKADVLEKIFNIRFGLGGNKNGVRFHGNTCVLEVGLKPAADGLDLKPKFGSSLNSALRSTSSVSSSKFSSPDPSSSLTLVKSTQYISDSFLSIAEKVSSKVHPTGAPSLLKGIPEVVFTFAGMVNFIF
jgi:hypothetical protein